LVLQDVNSTLQISAGTSHQYNPSKHIFAR
jgi:hypothetical protein